MRKIKFRIWNGSKMNYPTNIQQYQNCELHTGYAKDYDEKGNLLQRNLKVSVLMQFVGIIAKNDIYVYEGDILRHPNGEIGVVEWLECGFVLQNLSNTVWQNLLHNVIGHYDVIGNIYENANLIPSVNA